MSGSEGSNPGSDGEEFRDRLEANRFGLDLPDDLLELVGADDLSDELLEAAESNDLPDELLDGLDGGEVSDELLELASTDDLSDELLEAAEAEHYSELVARQWGTPEGEWWP